MRRHFFIKNFIQVSLPVIMAIVMIGIVAVYLTINESEKYVEGINQQTIERIQRNTELLFSEADAQSLNYSVSPSVMLRLEELLNKGYNNQETRKITNILKTFIDSNVNSKEFLHSVYIYIDNPNGNFFSSMVGLANATNVSDTEWLDRLDAMPADKNQWVEPRTIVRYMGVTQYTTEVISMYKWLYTSGRPGKIGILVLNVYRDYLEKMFEDNLSYPGQMILLLDLNDKVLCTSGTEVTTDSMREGYLSEHYFVQRKANEALGISYLSLIPKDVLYLQSKEIMITILSVILIVLLICATLAFFITRQSTGNIDGIIQLLYAAENGEELPTLPNRNDVYGYITHNIVKTYLERNQLDRQLLEKKLKLEAMHFSFLQSQLNPHFLFNTLKNIFWKTVGLTGAPNEASKMIELLTSVLHYTLVHPNRYVSLEEEIVNTQKYIQIQQMRFDNGFTDVWDADPELRKERCIKFLLQPLVENSISHGLSGRNDGVITIKIQRQENRIQFSVADNGRGFSPERLSEVCRKMQEEDSPTEHIGLFNLNKRLILAYDAEAALHIESIYGRSTVISFTIPICDIVM